MSDSKNEFTHLSVNDQPRMVDISEKSVTERKAVAVARVHLGAELAALLKDTGSTKKLSSSYYTLTIILKSRSKKLRNSLVLKLKEKGIQTSIYYPHPVPLLNYYRKKYNYKLKTFKNANRIAYNSISFSIAPHIKNKDVKHMSTVIQNLIG